MKLTLLSNDGGLVRLACEGMINQHRFHEEGDPLERLLGRDGFGGPVLMNLEKAEYIDSGGISWLLISHKHFLQAGGKLVIHSIPPRVNDVLQLLRMPSVLFMAKDEAAARALARGDRP